MVVVEVVDTCFSTGEGGVTLSEVVCKAGLIMKSKVLEGKGDAVEMGAEQGDVVRLWARVGACVTEEAGGGVLEG